MIIENSLFLSRFSPSLQIEISSCGRRVKPAFRSMILPACVEDSGEIFKSKRSFPWTFLHLDYMFEYHRLKAATVPINIGTGIREEPPGLGDNLASSSVYQGVGGPERMEIHFDQGTPKVIPYIAGKCCDPP